jgi:hypothetical protein
MQFHDDDLLRGEELLVSKFANAVVTPAEHGLSRFAADDLMWTVGMKDKEAIGGQLHLTTYRLLFRSHTLNRLTGDIELFLPTILSLQNTSYLWTRKFAVDTSSARYEFVMWGIAKFLRRVTEASDALGVDSVARIRSAVLDRADGSGLTIHNGAERANRMFATTRQVAETAALVANPLKGLAVVAMEELFDNTVAERWNRRFTRASD